jgi:hypothetical protein
MRRTTTRQVIDPMASEHAEPHTDEASTHEAGENNMPAEPTPMPKEIGGPKGPEPTRYGDWERNGRCSDF